MFVFVHVEIATYVRNTCVQGTAAFYLERCMSPVDCV